MASSPSGSPQYVTGEEVSFRFDPGIIVASYFVSLIGSVTTVELLHRRREGRGLTSWLQQLAISVSFGLVAIWCMHFVGNRAIILGDGRSEIQLYYNAGFTALSVFLPIIFLFFGFTTVALRQPDDRFFWPALVLAGIIAGLAITGMHYVGNFGITNYKLINPAGYVIGAAAIAIGASVIALTLFFYFKERWINSWPRRLACASVLAGAVSGMHWTASVGTRYTLQSLIIGASGRNRDTNLIVAIVVSLLACLLCMVFGLLTQRRRRQLEDRAQHVVLASATFDADGKILVTPQGLLPCQKITKQYNQRSFNDEFNVAHPVFQWIFRVTFNWQGVADLVPAMRGHLRSVNHAKENVGTRPMTPVSEATYDSGEMTEDYSIIFREQFCVAASDLSHSLQERIQDLGVLYNRILMTGSLANEHQPKRVLRLASGGRTRDMEASLLSPIMFGKGQLLFLVRVVDRPHVSRLISAGYRFAHPAHVGDIIARSMQVPYHDTISTIDQLRQYSKQTIVQRPTDAEEPQYSASIACFAMRAAVNKASGNWEVLVPIDSPFQLPQAGLSAEPLKPLQTKILGRMDGWSANQCLSYLNNKAAESTSADEKDFLELLLDQVTSLTISVPESFFGDAIFSSKPIRVPGMSSTKAGGIPVYIYPFCIIPDVHASSIKSTNKLTYVPLSFFKCFQRVNRGSPDHAILARKIHREFGAILSVKGMNNASMSSQRNSEVDSFTKPQDRRSKLWRFSTFRKTDDIVKSDFASDKVLVEPPDNDASAHAFGGIMVSNTTTVEVHPKQDSTLELQQMGLKTEATAGASEQPTYVDELFSITSSRWRHH